MEVDENGAEHFSGLEGPAHFFRSAGAFQPRLVTDNGSWIVSQEFETFLRKNGVKHITSAPFHPASNGLAERAVQIVKMGLKKESSGDMTFRLAKILMAYRTTLLVWPLLNCYKEDVSAQG